MTENRAKRDFEDAADEATGITAVLTANWNEILSDLELSSVTNASIIFASGMCEKNWIFHFFS